MKRFAAFFVFILCMTFWGGPCMGQDSGKWFTPGNLWRMLTAPNKNLDPDYIYQMPVHFTVSPDYKWTKTGASLDSDVESGTGEDAITGNISLKLRDRAYNSLGAKLSYGPLSLGYSFEVGKHENVNKSNSIKLYASSYGVRARYTTIKQNVAAALHIDGAEDPFSDYVFDSSYPASMKTIEVDGYYAMNRRKFSYVAAFDGGKLIQRRSAGSVVFVGKYSRGTLSIDPKDESILNVMAYTGEFLTSQLSFGAGYSHNFVFFHHDPGDGKFKGLRNLTLSLNLAPTISFVNDITMNRYVYPKWSDVTEKYLSSMGYDSYVDDRDGEAVRRLYYEGTEKGEKHKVKGILQPNLVARTGVFWAMDRFYLNAYADYSMVHFNGGKQHYKASQSGTGEDYSVKTKGNFTQLIVGVNVGIRF